jgi:hypothetical protein
MGLSSRRSILLNMLYNILITTASITLGSLRMSGAMAARWFSVMDVYHLTSPKVVGSSPALFVHLFVLHACLEPLHFRADGHRHSFGHSSMGIWIWNVWVDTPKGGFRTYRI